MLERTKQVEIAFAGLLHDIGKFKQRAAGGDEKEINPKTKTMEAQILPSTNGWYGYRHALFTYDFFINDLFPLLQGTQLHDALDWELVAREAASHHNPSSGSLSEIIARADRASAGNDRAYAEKIKSGEYLNVPLRPIFTSISEDKKHQDGGSTKSPYGYELRKLTDHQELAGFPQKEVIVSAVKYHDLYQIFLQDLAEAVHEAVSCEGFLAKLKDLMLTYTWCIPSATNDYLNDVSLYDHSITTMGIALALANAENTVHSIRLCVFDVSGIQSFIFQSKYTSFPDAAKIFRGRSFLVSATTTALKLSLCSYLGLLPYVDCIDAGGKLTLLLPNRSDLDAKLAEYQSRLDRFLVQKNFGTMSILMDYSISIGPDDLGGAAFKNVQALASARLSAKKKKKFISGFSDPDFALPEVDLAAPVCKACGKQSAGSEDEICDLCEHQRTLGAQLPHRNLVVFSSHKGGYELLPGVYLSLFDSDREGFESAFSLGGDDARYPTWHVNMHVPEDNTFEDIANHAVQDGKGKPFLGYVKIDVDSLGEIFQTGFSDKEYSLSRYVTLSRMLHLFFNGYVRSLLETSYPYAYTVLSGGDDAFFILPWTQAVPLVQDIRNAFTKFCCGNLLFHFSAGIVVAGAKEPFAFVNKKTNSALDDQAKEEPGKNAVSYFGVCFSPSELVTLQDDTKHLRTLVSQTTDDGKPITMGFLYRLLSYVNDRLLPGQETVNLRRKYSTYGKLRYDVTRNLNPENKEHPEWYQDAIRFVLDRFDNFKDEHALRQFNVMLVQTIYSLRSTKGEEE